MKGFRPWRWHRDEMDGMSNREKQEVGRWTNSSHLPFDDPSGDAASLDRKTYKERRFAARVEWQSLAS